jgi:hypothetical protein
MSLLVILALTTATPAPDAFSRADTNGDGYISVVELKAARLASFDRMDANGDGVLTRADNAGRIGPSPDLNAFDANKDGQVTRAELAIAPAPMFNRLDANKDGRLSRSEAAFALRFMGTR